MCFADFGAYCDIHSKADRTYLNRDLWKEKSLNARKLAEEKFSWDKVSLETIKQYEEIVK